MMSSTLQQFAKVIDEVTPELSPSPETLCSCAAVVVVVQTPNLLTSLTFQLSSCHAVLSTQLADAMMFPITQFKERDLKGGKQTHTHTQLYTNNLNLSQTRLITTRAVGDVMSCLLCVSRNPHSERSLPNIQRR